MCLNFLSSVGWYFDFASIPSFFLYTFFITFHKVLMYTIFLCVFYTGWASLFFCSSASGLLIFGLGGGGFFQDLLQACFSLFSEDISEYRIGGGGCGRQVYKV